MTRVGTCMHGVAFNIWCERCHGMQRTETGGTWPIAKEARPQKIAAGAAGDAEQEAEESGFLMTTKPTIVCLCGSTRFSAAFREANLRETLAGRIVLSIGCDMRSDTEIFGPMSEAERAEVKARLDELHKRKIDLADEIVVLNVGGYVGSSTASEIAYAIAHGKRVRWLEPDAAPVEWGRDVQLASEPELRYRETMEQGSRVVTLEQVDEDDDATP